MPHWGALSKSSACSTRPERRPNGRLQDRRVDPELALWLKQSASRAAASRLVAEAEELAARRHWLRGCHLARRRLALLARLEAPAALEALAAAARPACSVEQTTPQSK